MSDIAAQLGMSKKTLYLYIENKNDLVEKILKKYIENEKQMCNQAAETAEDALQEMFSISIQVQRNIENMNPSLLFGGWNSRCMNLCEAIHNLKTPLKPSF